MFYICFAFLLRGADKVVSYIIKVPGTLNFIVPQLLWALVAYVMISCVLKCAGQTDDLPLPRVIRTLSEHCDVTSISP